jgi:hypothetical protein
MEVDICCFSLLLRCLCCSCGVSGSPLCCCTLWWRDVRSQRSCQLSSRDLVCIVCGAHFSWNVHYVGLFVSIGSSCLYSLFVFTVYNHCLYMWCGVCVVLSGGFLHCCVSVVTRVWSCLVFCFYCYLTSLANYTCVFDGFTPSYSSTHNGDDAPQTHQN